MKQKFSKGSFRRFYLQLLLEDNYRVTIPVIVRRKR